MAIEVDRKRQQITERIFDPESRVLKSQVSSEVSTTDEGTNAAVTVASNLPEGEGGQSRSNSERSETTESVTYEVSETVRNIETSPGDIRRLTIAILINDQAVVTEDGAVSFQPRSAEELSSVEALVKDAAGVNEERGDSLTVKSMPFEIIEIPEMLQPQSAIETFLDRYMWPLIQSLILAFLTLGLGMFVIRPIFTQRAQNNADAESGLALLPIGQDNRDLRLNGDSQGQYIEQARLKGLPEGGAARNQNDDTSSLERLQSLAEVEKITLQSYCPIG